MKQFSFIHPDSDLSAVVHVLNVSHGTVAKHFRFIALIDSHAKLKSWYLSQGFQQVGVKVYEHLPFDVCFMRKELIPSKA